MTWSLTLILPLTSLAKLATHLSLSLLRSPIVVQVPSKAGSTVLFDNLQHVLWAKTTPRSRTHSNTLLYNLTSFTFKGTVYHSPKGTLRVPSILKWYETATVYPWAHARSFNISKWNTVLLHLECYQNELMISYKELSNQENPAVLKHLRST